jgi:predicted phosphodiesterase
MHREIQGARLKIAIISDVHANIEALSAVLAAIDAEGVDRLVCLGDIVGYYAEPDACVEILGERGAIAVAGNHDRVAAGLAEPTHFGRAARHAIVWTRAQIRAETARTLARLPLHATVDGAFLAFHGALHPRPDPERYLSSDREVEKTFAALSRGGFGVDVGFFGHTHRSVVYARCRGRISRVPGLLDVGQGAAAAGPPVTLRPDTRYLINPGSVGQPRDGDPRASFVIWNGARRSVRFHRVAYDVRGCLAKAERAGLLWKDSAPDAGLRRLTGWLAGGVTSVKRRLA